MNLLQTLPFQKVEEVRFLLDVFIGLCADNTKEEYAKPALDAVAGSPLKTLTNRLKVGFYNQQSLILIIANQAKVRGREKTGVPLTLLTLVLQRLGEYGIVLQAPTGNLTPEIQFVPEALILYSAMGILENIVFGPQYMVEVRQPAIPAINVRSPADENGRMGHYSGTGALVSTAKGIHILTNRHVVEGNVIKEIVGGSTVYNVTGEPILSDIADLAIIPVIAGDAAPSPFFLTSSDMPTLSAVISLGYPLISRVNQTLLAHRGEVNGQISTIYGDKFLAISNYVRPGNSGGPLLTEHGLLAGIVAQSNEGDFATEGGLVTKSIYHMAIPASVCAEFLESAFEK